MPATSSTRVQQYRARLRNAGLRPVQIWVPDTRSDAFKASCAQQARAVAEMDETEDWRDAVQDTTGWT